jgi:hypothetical protein
MFGKTMSHGVESGIILSRVLVTIDGVLLWVIGFIDAQYSKLQAIERYRYATRFPVHRYTRIRVLSLH